MSGVERTRTFECPHCGSETFGLVVKDGAAVAARCRLCDELLFFEHRSVDQPDSADNRTEGDK